MDFQLLFSNAQALTSSAVSENIIDLGGKNRGAGQPLHVRCQVGVALTGGTSVQVSLKHASSAAGVAAGTKLWEGPAIAAASLVAGYVFDLPPLPPESERYVGLYYTIVGTFSAGSVDAGIVLDRPTLNNSLAVDTDTL